MHPLFVICLSSFDRIIFSGHMIQAGEPCPFWFNPIVEMPRPQSYYRSDWPHVYLPSLGIPSPGRQCAGHGCQSVKQAPTALCSCSLSKYLCLRCYLWHIASSNWKSYELTRCIEQAENELAEVKKCLAQLN